MELTEKQKIEAVISILYKKRIGHIMAHEIRNELKNKITKDDLDDTLDYLIDNGLVEVKYYTKLDVPAPYYRLSKYNLLNIENQIEAKTSGQIRTDTEQLKNKKPETLFDIWLPDSKGEKEKMYKYFIDYLKKEYRETASSFVTETNKKLSWNKVPQRGWQQYMAGFVFTCIKKQWISDQYSAPTFVKILNNTFNAKPDKRWFKSISANPPDDKYLIPFKDLPTNI